MNIVLAAVPIANTRIPPLSLAMLAASLRSAGHRVRALDLNIDAFHRVEPGLREYWKFYMGHHWQDTASFTRIIYPRIVERFLDGWVEEILAFAPKLVGISVNTTPIVRALATRLKERRPDLRIALGGPTCSLVYGRIAARPSPFEEAVVSGEGEETLLELAEGVAATGEFPIARGATILRGGNYIYGGDRPPIADLDALPFADFGDFDLSRYRDIDIDSPVSLPIHSSRGCVARCAFCMDNRFWGGRYRPRDPERVAAEMAHQAERHGVRSFTFVDLAFNGSAHRLDRLGDALLARDGGLDFWAPARIDRRLTRPLLEKLRRAGLRHLNFGLESASDRVLARMRKGYTSAEAQQVLDACHAAGITVSLNLIAGFPGETLVDLLATARFVWRNRDRIWNRPGVTDCAAIPGTELHDHPERFGIVYDPADRGSHYAWRSRDGGNTHRSRRMRRDALNWLFARIPFQEDRRKS